MGAWLAPVIIVLVLVAIYGAASIRIVKEYERGVLFATGRLVGARGPGLFFVPPLFKTMTRIDLRIATIDVPVHEAITRDSVTVDIIAVVFYRVVEPEAALVRAADYVQATREVTQTTVRSVVGQSKLDDLLAERPQINQRLQQAIDERTDAWGVRVPAVEIKDVKLPEDLQRAMASQAEAEREGRVKVIQAEAEFQAAQRLADASRIISAHPAALQLRYLQTLADISSDRTNTVIFPLPIDLVKAFLVRNSDKGSDGGT